MSSRYDIEQLKEQKKQILSRKKAIPKNKRRKINLQIQKIIRKNQTLNQVMTWGVEKIWFLIHP